MRSLWCQLASGLSCSSPSLFTRGARTSTNTVYYPSPPQGQGCCWHGDECGCEGNRIRWRYWQ
jgi:hypothetical protein